MNWPKPDSINQLENNNYNITGESKDEKLENNSRDRGCAGNNCIDSGYQQKKIIGFKQLTLPTIAQLYNTGDPRYADKLEYCLKIIG